MANERQSRETSDTRETRAAARRESESRSKFRVKPGHSITAATGETDERGFAISRTYSAGEEVELSEKDAEAAAHAVEKGERRSGQTNRLKRRIAELESQMKEQEDLLKRAGKKDPELQKALDSIKKRGDNYIARNEPDPRGAPRDAIDAFEAEFGPVGSGLSQDEIEEGVGGMKGVGTTERASGPAGPDPGVGGSPNQPSKHSSPNPATTSDDKKGGGQ